MHRFRAGWIAAALTCFLAFPVQAGQHKPLSHKKRTVVPVDTLFIHGKVITADERFSIRSVVAVRDGRIVAVGGPLLARNFRARQVIDLHGRVLMPGFNDTHVHLIAQEPRAIDVGHARSIAQVQAMLAAKARALGPGEWITGSGWDEAQFAEKRNLSRGDLDAAAPDNPVALVRAGAHSVAGNSRAFALAKITPSTPEPERGLIERDAHGQPTGIIRERTDLLLSLVPPTPPEVMRPLWDKALRDLLPLGITSLGEALSFIDDEPVGQGGSGKPGNRHTWRDFRAIYAKDGENLPRATIYISYPGAERLKQFPHHTGYGDDRLKLGPIGEFPAVDGGFTGPTAWTSADYKGLPGFRGAAMTRGEELEAMIRDARDRGWQLGIHAIGDAAITELGRAYSKVLDEKPMADHRWFAAHYTMLPPPETLRLFAGHKVWAAIQPNFLYNLEGRYNQTLDGARLEHINPTASLIRAGIPTVLGSDNLPIGPMVGLYAAITRKGPSGHVYAADEAISRAQAITLYTAKAAWLTRDERKKGSIEKGKLADMIVLDADILTIPAEQILTTRVDMTMVGGRVVFDRQSAP